MRICHVTPLPPVKSGISKYSKELILSLQKRGIEGFAVSTGRSFSNVEVLNFDLLRLDRIMHEVRKRKPDLIHYQFGASYKNYFVMICNRLLKSLDFPQVVTIHDVPFISLIWLNKVEPLRASVWRAFLRRVEKLLCDSNDALIVHSLYAKRLLHEYFGVDRNKVTIIPHGLLLMPSSKDKERLKEILNLPQDEVVILSGGGIYPHKGLDDLLLAFLKVNEKASLVILGEGPYLSYLKQLAQDLRVDERVRFTGYLSDNTMADYFKACDFVVSAKKSSYGETSGMLVNAVASGKPIIATNVGANRELVINQENGFLIQPGDVESLELAMNTLIESPHLGAKMGEKSLEMAKNLDWDVVCGQTEKIYKNALYQRKVETTA